MTGALRELVDGITQGTPAEGALAGFSAEEAELLQQAAHEIVALDGLFSPYVSPQLAARLREHPELAELGGVVAEIDRLFSDRFDALVNSLEIGKRPRGTGGGSSGHGGGRRPRHLH